MPIKKQWFLYKNNSMAKNLLSFVEQEKNAKNDKKNDKTKKLNF